MKKTKFYQAFHEPENPALQPYFGTVYHSENNREYLNTVFGFPTTSDPQNEIIGLIEKAKEMYSENKVPSKCFIFYADPTSNFMFSSFNRASHKMLFGSYKVQIILINLDSIEKMIDELMNSHQKINNMLVFMYTYYCGTDEKIRNIISQKQAEFLDADWQNLLSDANLQEAFATFFMEDNPLINQEYL